MRRRTDQRAAFQAWHDFWEVEMPARGLGHLEVMELQAFVYGLTVCKAHPGHALKAAIASGGVCPCTDDGWRRYLDRRRDETIANDDKYVGGTRASREAVMGEVMAQLISGAIAVP
jgi:hypothetical protein